MIKETKQAFDNIVDSITCADGGARFIKFTTLIKELDKRAEMGDESAKQIIGTVMMFSRLIDVASK